MVSSVAAVIVEAVVMAPVEPETVKLVESTAMPPSKLTKVVVVAPLPVTVANVEVLFTVTVSVADVTTLMSVPSAKVNVLPWSIVCGVVPSVMVKSVPPETKQVEQEISPAAEREIGEEAETATVPEALGNVQVLVVLKLAAVNCPTFELLLK
jgi:hypothetical protein